MNKTQEMNISDDARFSHYFKKHKERPSCPFCGARMYFTYNIHYEGRYEFWVCLECGCSLPNKEDFTEEEKKIIRVNMRKTLKEEIAKDEEKIQKKKERLKLWGKYMSDQEKVRLLGEALEPEHSN